MSSSSFNFNRHHPYKQVNTNEILKKVRDQEKFKKLSNKDQDEIYRLHVISLFEKKGINMYPFETELKIDNPYIFKGEGEINMLGFIKNLKVLVQSKFELITPNEIRNFAKILSNHGEDTIGIFVASSFSKKAMNFANMNPRKIFLIMDNLNELNNFDEVYNDITRYLFHKENDDKKSNNYHNDVNKIGHIKITLKNQSLEYFNLNIYGNGESIVEVHDITFSI
ncbi:26977_t:CDS:2 [Gigaspora margarita]|uniref:26977_t:CDS:1 n=1 Tax=Gigaspora margarita TaxID=4874 RepID=A0ABN7UEI1_GIGMA|nr:26977_t:CDS:2 [Gigaspora margarita]